MRAFTCPLNILNGTLASTTSYDKIVRDQLINALTTNQGERVTHRPGAATSWACSSIRLRRWSVRMLLPRSGTCWFTWCLGR